MIAIAIETSTRTGSVAVRALGATRASALAGERAHASDLLPALARCLDELGLRARDVEAVLVGIGPGSYTGLRIGIATALGLVRASSAALRGVPSCEALVHERLARGARASVIIDAHAGELYFARYERGDLDVHTLVPPRIATPHELTELVDADDTILADEAGVRAARLEEPLLQRVIAAAPHASSTLALGLTRLHALGPHSASAVEPLYLREFAARVRTRG